MFPSTSSRETLRFSGNKIHCSPRDQSLSVYYSTSTKNNFIQQQGSRTFKISSFNKIPRPSYPASSRFLRQTREKPLRAIVCFSIEHARVRHTPRDIFDVNFTCQFCLEYCWLPVPGRRENFTGLLICIICHNLSNNGYFISL